MQELKQVQEKSLEMAKYFVNFCEENNLLCYLCGGGAIGALRHKGFIPWDDDLDFFMPRKDYEKLFELWKKKADKRYFISKSGKKYIDRNLFITIRDRNTTCIKPYQKDLNIPHGLALDVLPLDYYPKSRIERKKQILWALIYSLYCAQTVPTNHGKIMNLGSKILLKIIPKKLRYKIWKFAEKNMTKYERHNSDGITELCSGPHYMMKKYPMDAFDDKIYKEFEETKMPIPVGYDKYLKTAFGDYMTPPSLDKQRPHHDAIIIDMNKSYKNYIGKNR